MDLTNELKGKVVVASGGSRGIGFGAVKQFLAYGAKVCFLSHYEETGKKAMEELKAINPNYPVMTFHPDLCNLEEVTAVFNEVTAAWGPVDILVNNAGMDSGKFLHRLTMDDWKEVMDTNINSMFVMCKAGVKSMDRSKGGAIVNTASVAGVYGSAMGLPYPVSKAGVIGLTKSLANELSPFRIRVNAIAPGVIATDMVAGLNDMAKQSIEGAIPFKRMGTPEDVANLITFLASDAAGYITGQTIGIDAGYRPEVVIA